MSQILAPESGSRSQAGNSKHSQKPTQKSPRGFDPEISFASSAAVQYPTGYRNLPRLWGMALGDLSGVSSCGFGLFQLCRDNPSVHETLRKARPTRTVSMVVIGVVLVRRICVHYFACLFTALDCIMLASPGTGSKVQDFGACPGCISTI